MLVYWKQFDLVAAEWKLVCCLGLLIVANEEFDTVIGLLRRSDVTLVAVDIAGFSWDSHCDHFIVHAK